MTANIWSKNRRVSMSREVRQSPASDFDPAGIRSVFQQDYDRLLFSTPVRRLADKTQVWPMDENDGVRTRLTHSHEVANLARSIGTRSFLDEKVKIAFPDIDLAGTIQPILSSVGLAHDIGNPPFGHQGEKAISDWFKERNKWIFTHYSEDGDELDESDKVQNHLKEEFTSFDGNPQGLRLISTLQTHQYKMGLDLTAATLAATLKYAVHVSNRNSSKENKNAAAEKGGYFESEREIVDWIRLETGLAEGQRHPIAWIGEACDDIAYSVLDVDDLLKKGIVSPDEVMSILTNNKDINEYDCIEKILNKFDEINQSDRRAEIKSDIKIQYIRAYNIDRLIRDASETFAQNVQSIKGMKHKRGLMDDNPLCEALKKIARSYGFSHRSVLRTEAVGAATIDGLMSAIWEAISHREKKEDLRSRRKTAKASYVFSLVSPNYIEAAEDAASKDGAGSSLRYRELRLLTDMISGMTDTYATKLWQDIASIPDVGS
ncbi:dGTP triphosphohydrolase [Azorhizobium caulinodans]|uniref:deoxyguanosinetriphosphate triphosphohydrolase family protein n=1 Tax=Azorhizobium caulinodans TaxID=7 RepID=UPI002FBE86FA